MKKILLFISMTLGMHAQSPVLPSDQYYLSEENNATYIYSKEYSGMLDGIKKYHQNILDVYQKSFGYTLDDTLYTGFASLHNQIANGFSTQMPFNAQLNYGAGAGALDYFSTSSWLKILLIHETAHNYQLNPKENAIAKATHKIVKNTYISGLGPIPIFPIPNVFIGSFILEGNAVLNESRFGIGGRLFSGKTVAEAVLLAKAGKLSPEFIYNNVLDYPYREKYYLVGGLFQAYLAKQYGVEKVNKFFKEYSKQYLPFYLNDTFKTYYGKNFETLLSEFKNDLLAKHQSFQKTNTKVLAHSKFFQRLTGTKKGIVTLTTDAKSAPEIVRISKDGTGVEKSKTSLPFGQIYEYKNAYYTQSTSYTSPLQITQGLYDDDRYLLTGTGSKVVQGVMPDGKMVYVDINSSLEYPHIYVDGKFYDTAHSSVLVDAKGDLYYFKQNKENRVLYKNKKKIFSFQGHYSVVTDVDEHGGVYFIAASKDGTTLYRVKNNHLTRMLSGDDVVDMKLLDNQRMYVVTMSDDGYNYGIINKEEKKASIPTLKYAFENEKDKTLFDNSNFHSTVSTQKQKYSPFIELKYSSLNQTMGYDGTGFVGNFVFNFTDPLMQNSLNLITSTQSDYSLLGVAYDNNAYRLNFGFSAFAVLNQDEVSNTDNNLTDEYRDYGYAFYLKYPFLHSGYWYGDARLDYVKPFDNVLQKPVTASINFTRKEQYGLSKYANSLYDLSLFASTDRGNATYGANYTFMHDFAYQSYVSLGGTYMKSKLSSTALEKGIAITDNKNTYSFSPNSIEVKGLGKDYFAKELKMAEAGLYKVFDASAYFFSFPLSLQRESLYAKERLYDIKTEDESFTYHESVLGLELDLLVYHELTMPLQIEWIHNEDVETKDRVNVQFSMGF